MKMETNRTTNQKTSRSSKTEGSIKDTTTKAGTRNTSKTTNHPAKVIWTSSYDRGLEHLLKIWPDVKKDVPDAELHIYYGWTLFERFYKDNPERMAWMKKINQMMQYDGITHHGRVSQPVMHERMKECGVWAYPTHFGEISCITAMKAQILGCVPVVVEYAALETTVQYGLKIKGDVYDPNVLQDFKLQLIELLLDTKRQEKIRKEMMPWAKKEFTWTKVAQQWDADFKEEGK